ncbi:MAG: hypothetical protein ACTSXF_10050, partial [Promethearchaeota archaeon]
RIELENKVNAYVQKLETLLNEYEKDTSDVVFNEIPQAKKLSDILGSFKTQFLAVNEKILQTINDYNKKGLIDVHSILNEYRDHFDELKNRVKFVISKLLSSFLDNFKDILEQEQTFFIDLVGVVNSRGDNSDTEVEGKAEGEVKDNTPLQYEELPLSVSIDLLMPERFTEKELREKLRILDQKIKSLDETKQIYLKERQKYEELLDKFIKERDNIESPMCVICHKRIDLVHDHYIRCPFCGRLSHYLCSAWWLEKHNTCPVCNNTYTLPNSGMFDLSEGTSAYNPESQISENEEHLTIPNNEGASIDIDKLEKWSEEDFKNSDEEDNEHELEQDAEPGDATQLKQSNPRAHNGTETSNVQAEKEKEKVENKESKKKIKSKSKSKKKHK